MRLKRGSFAILAIVTGGCILPGYDIDRQGADGGGSGTGGSSGSAGTGGSSGSAGDQTGGTGGGDSSGASGGSTVTLPECETHSDCIDNHQNLPYLCREGSCLALTNEECPALLGAGDKLEALREKEPILIGAYDNIDPLTPTTSDRALNYWLAIDEVNRSGGLPPAPRRPFVAILCQANQPDIEASMSHLVDDVQVAGIIATLYTDELLEAYEEHAAPTNTFMINSLSADGSLTESFNGLLWHMLGTGPDLARAYVPLMERAETFMRAAIGDSPQNPNLRVAMLVADVPFLRDMAEEVSASIRFNDGKSPAENGNNLFKRFDTDAAANGEVNLDQMDSVVKDLLDFAPNVIIALSTHEFSVHILQQLEQTWGVDNPSTPRPFYLLSPFTVTNHLTNVINNSIYLNDAPSRMLGVNYAAAEDSTLYDAYLLRLQGKFGDDAPQGKENFYDAAYFLMYAIAGAGDLDSLDGDSVHDGMLRLLDGDPFDVGESDVDRVLSRLRTTEEHISLQGTLGPPDFDLDTGARRVLPSIYCLDDTNALTFRFDVMTYDEDSGELVGEQPCGIGF